MNTLITLKIYGFDSTQALNDITMFRAEDATGSFAILPGHDYFMTILTFGMTILHHQDMTVRYLALPGGLLHVRKNCLTIHTRHFWLGDDYAAMSALLRQHVTVTEESLHKNKANLERIEQSMIKHMLDMERQQ